LFRALRVDKLTYAVLEATLLSYLKHDHDAIPALRMMRLTREDIRKRAESVTRQILSSRMSLEIIDGESVIGGGSAPSSVLPTSLLSLTCDGLSANDLATALRACDPPLVVRVEAGRVLVDLRTVFPDQDAIVVKALNGISGI